jgi:hypothetical protein
VGGVGPKVLDRVLAYADGWMPNREAGLAARVAELQERAAALGRGHVPVTYFGADRDAAALERLQEAGVDRTLFYLTSAETGVVARELDELVKLTS